MPVDISKRVKEPKRGIIKASNDTTLEWMMTLVKASLYTSRLKFVYPLSFNISRVTLVSNDVVNDIADITPYSSTGHQQNEKDESSKF